MQMSAKHAQSTPVTLCELQHCSLFNAAATPHAFSQSCQRQLAAAAQSVDEYDAREQHRRRGGRGRGHTSKTRRKSELCGAHTPARGPASASREPPWEKSPDSRSVSSLGRLVRRDSREPSRGGGGEEGVRLAVTRRRVRERPNPTPG